MFVAVLPGDPSLVTVLGVVFLLVIVPLVVFAVVVIATGYLQHDAEAFLEELAEEEGLEEAGPVEEGLEEAGPVEEGTTANGRTIDDEDAERDR